MLHFPAPFVHTQPPSLSLTWRHAYKIPEIPHSSLTRMSSSTWLLPSQHHAPVHPPIPLSTLPPSPWKFTKSSLSPSNYSPLSPIPNTTPPPISATTKICRFCSSFPDHNCNPCVVCILLNHNKSLGWFLLLSLNYSNSSLSRAWSSAVVGVKNSVSAIFIDRCAVSLSRRLQESFWAWLISPVRHSDSNFQEFVSFAYFVTGG